MTRPSACAVARPNNGFGASDDPFSQNSVLSAALTFGRFVRLNASQITCSCCERPSRKRRATRGSSDPWYGRRYWFLVVSGARSLNALPSPLMSPLTNALYGRPVCHVYTTPYSQFSSNRFDSPRRSTTSSDVSYIAEAVRRWCWSLLPGARVSSICPWMASDRRPFMPPNTIAIGSCAVSSDRAKVYATV